MPCQVYHKTNPMRKPQLTVFKDFFQTSYWQTSCQMQRDERKRCFSCFFTSLKTQQHFCRKEYVYAAEDQFLIRKRFPRTFFIGFLIPQKQTGSVLLLFLQQILSIMTFVICKSIKKSSRIKYSYCGEQLNIKEIYSQNKKRRGRSKYLLSVNVMFGKENPIPSKIVCVRNKANRNDWLAIICTDTTLFEEEIIRIYGKRWQIEVFFKTCKSMLNLIGECHSLSYDALKAHMTIVFTRYMLLAMEQRQNEDQRTFGELFFFLVDEMADITFSKSLGILIDAFIASLQEILKLSDEQLTAFTASFEARLPEYLRMHFIQKLQRHKSPFCQLKY